jgi:putative two-component system response regulator
MNLPVSSRRPRRTARRILVVDDERANVTLLTRLMVDLGYEVVTASDGQAALDSVAAEHPDLILLDINMPKVDGFEVCRRLKSSPSTRLLPIVLITGLTASEDHIRGIEVGADDFLTKPFKIPELEARVRSLLRLKRYTDELDSAESMILSLGLTIEARDPYTQNHCEHLAQYASVLGAALGLDERERLAIDRGAFLHDVGKVGIPDAILLKQDRLTPRERSVMEQHTVIGDRLCGELNALADVRPIIRHHHERLDGTGYPDHLAGNDVPLLAQIISVVDVYDALTTDRPYRAPLTADAAFEELQAEVKRGWKSAELVEAFVELGRSGRLDAAALPPLGVRPPQRWD